MNAGKDSEAVTATNGLSGMATCSRARAKAHFCRQYPELFALHPVDDYIQLLDTTQRGKSMYDVSPRVTAFRERVISEWGAEALEMYHRVTMLSLIDAFRERAREHHYPESVRQQFRVSFSRIQNNIVQGAIGTYPHTGDNFIKDFSLCLQTAFPGGGAWVVDHNGGFTRSVAIRGGVGQFFRLAWLCLFVTRGHRPMYSPHIHNELADKHTPEERLACHLRIAEMLECHPQVKGMAAASWLTDPALRTISPKLRWVREIPEANGCEYFRVRTDIHGGALTRSLTRRKLYEEGKYIPTMYLNIWSRKRMIAWARRTTEQESGLHYTAAQGMR